jgi:hypothetical protein
MDTIRQLSATKKVSQGERWGHLKCPFRPGASGQGKPERPYGRQQEALQKDRTPLLFTPKENLQYLMYSLRLYGGLLIF